MRAADLFLGCFMFWKLFWPNKESKLMGIYIVLRRPARAKTALGIALRRKQRHRRTHARAQKVGQLSARWSKNVFLFSERQPRRSLQF